MSDRRLRYALLGRPVRHSFSPALHAAAYRSMGLPHVYTAVDVPSENSFRRLVEEVRRGTLAGVNVTAPYKVAALRFADQATPVAEEVGAANLLKRDVSGRVVADNTDVEALVEVLGKLVPSKGRAAVLGCGGAGLAALVACKRLGFSVVGVTTRSWSDSEKTFEQDNAERARAIGALTSPWPAVVNASSPTGKASMVLRLQWTELAQEADIIIQTTSAGSQGGAPGELLVGLVPWTKLKSSCCFLDVIYQPEETPILGAAEAHGHPIQNGLGMLVRQAELSVERWLGFEPPAGVMRRALDEVLAVRAKAEREADGNADGG